MGDTGRGGAPDWDYDMQGLIQTGRRSTEERSEEESSIYRQITSRNPVPRDAGACHNVTVGLVKIKFTSWSKSKRISKDMNIFLLNISELFIM